MFCSKLHNHAEKRCRPPHSQLLLLGHQHWWWEMTYTVHSFIHPLNVSFQASKIFSFIACKLSTHQYKKCYSPSISLNILLLLHLSTSLTIFGKCFFLSYLLVYLMCEIFFLFQEVALSGGRIAPCTVLSVCLLWRWQYNCWWRCSLNTMYEPAPITEKILYDIRK